MEKCIGLKGGLYNDCEAPARIEWAERSPVQAAPDAEMISVGVVDRVVSRSGPPCFLFGTSPRAVTRRLSGLLFAFFPVRSFHAVRSAPVRMSSFVAARC